MKTILGFAGYCVMTGFAGVSLITNGKGLVKYAAMYIKM